VTRLWQRVGRAVARGGAHVQDQRVRALLAPLCVLSLACRPARQPNVPEAYVRLERELRITSAVLADDTRVLFSWSDGPNRPVSHDPTWASGRSEYVGGAKALGLYDLVSGETHTLVLEPRFGTSDGNGDDRVVAARGEAALCLRERLTREGVLLDAGWWYLVSLADGKTARVDPQAELEELGLVPSADPRLVDGRGTLLLEARPSAGRTDVPLAPRLFLRDRDGALDDLGAGVFQGELAGLLYIERPGGAVVDTIDLATKARASAGPLELGLVAARGEAAPAARLEISPAGDAILYARSTGEVERLAPDLAGLSRGR
jgi:hypothetical protein